jgi:hypothetical protein
VKARHILALVVLCWLGSVASAQPVTISWRPPTGCTTGQAIAWNGTVWACGTTAGAGMTASGTTINVIATTGGGLTVAADSIGLLTSCAGGEILKWSGSAWACDADATIGGGAVTGTGTDDFIPRWNGTTAIEASLLSDNATTLAYNTNKFTVAAASGNTTVAGTLASTGAITDGGNRVFSVAGSGLSSSTSTVSLNITGASCSAGSYVSAIGATGTGTCTAEVGDITEVIAGAGMTGTATSGPVTLAVGAGTGITVNADDISVSSGVNMFSTNNTIPKGNGTTLAASALVDNGTDVIATARDLYVVRSGAADSSVVYLQNADVAWRAGIQGSTDAFEFAEYGVAVWATIAKTTGLATFSGSLTTNGNLTSGDAAGDVFDHNGDLAKFGATDGYVYFEGNTINYFYGTDSDQTGRINFHGYNAGSTRFRNLIIGDGKTADVATFTGSDKSLAVVGNLSTAANLTAGDSTADSHTINGTAVIDAGTSGAIAAIAATNLAIEGEASANNYISFRTHSATQAGLIFSNSTSAADGYIVYNNSTQSMTFATAITPSLTLSSAGLATFAAGITSTAGTNTFGRTDHSTISPTALSGDVDDYAPTGLSTTRRIVLSTNDGTQRTLNSLTGGAGGRTIEVYNTGPGTIRFQHEGTGTAANRFKTGDGGYTYLGDGSLLTLTYDSGDARWIVGQSSSNQYATVSTAALTVSGNATVTGMLNGYTQITQSADQDVTNLGVTDSDTLLISTSAGKIYAIDAFIIAGGNNTTGDYIFDFAVAAGTMDCTGTEQSVTTADAIQNTTIIATAAADTADTSVGTRADASIPIAIRIAIACKVSNTTTLKYRFGNAAAAGGRTSRTMAGSRMQWKLLN